MHASSAPPASGDTLEKQQQQWITPTGQCDVIRCETTYLIQFYPNVVRLAFGQVNLDGHRVRDVILYPDSSI